MIACPKCASYNIINIDNGSPPNLFECGSCAQRFHTVGFTPTEIEANQSLSILGQTSLTGLLRH